jgi:hypothetical protein
MHAYMNMTTPGAGELCMQAAMSVHRVGFRCTVPCPLSRGSDLTPAGCKSRTGLTDDETWELGATKSNCCSVSC